MKIRDRIKEFRRVPAAALRPSQKNWRTHPAAQREALTDLLKEVGYADALLARETANGELVLIDGHLRQEISFDQMVPVLILDVDEAEAAKLLATLDPLAAMAGCDQGKLDSLLREVQTSSEAVASLLTDLAKDNGILDGLGEPDTEDQGPAPLDLADCRVAECPPYDPPYQWFGGKSRVAPLIWAAFGDVENYCEPFFGAGHILMRRPHFQGDRTETINDADGFVANFWRAVQRSPEEVARWADWPVNENDLTARHAWLVGRRADLTRRLEGDPDWCDPKIAGWWVWGQCCWIGGGWCSGQGPWRVVDGRLIKDDQDGQGVNRQLPHLGNDGQGVNRKLPHLGNDGRGVNRKRPHLSDDGRGLCELYSQSMLAYLSGLRDRLRRVRVCSGDWSRVLTDAPTVRMGVTGVFLDPPYALSEREEGCYATDSPGLSDAVREWAIGKGDDPRFRIALCGYEGEHVMPNSWTTVAWKTAGGMANTSRQDTRAQENMYRERVWLSPSCFDVRMHPETVGAQKG